MSDKNLGIIQPVEGTPTPSKAKKVNKDSFTSLQTVLLILLTLVISVGGWYGVGKVYVWNNLDMQRVNAQLQYLKEKAQTDPADPRTRVELGYTFYLKGQNDQAIKELNQAVLLDPKNFDAYYNLGLVMLETKRNNEALGNFQKAIDLSPRDYKGHLKKGVAYRSLGMYEEAFQALQQANKLLPGNSDIIYETGKVAEVQGDIETAIDIYKEALAFDPLYKDAIEALERLGKNKA